uniref:Uncharacterized protein AlNc14C245G9535 n=1 Tax=Albugo laibachii Nc14 TaxID=890382 RepID=F0WT51_9STRA|nr:conserved hypothetical protein [Albugo laibachii Nc14]CCA25973.1 conserved hypothetical protein [Albugo laibachii Nc14]|eukprot:CCA25973.1 conserved hypothetical protein [Albugo laibachii Nc14]
MIRLSFPILVFITGLFLRRLASWEPQPDDWQVANAVSELKDLPSWKSNWTSWKYMELKRNKYHSRDPCTVYNRAEAKWMQSSFVQLFVLFSDRKLFDRENNVFATDSFINFIEKQFGKIDSILLWTSYPNLGIDSRNQWDFMQQVTSTDEEMGWDGLKSITEEFQRRGIRVLVPYLPWDLSTRIPDDVADHVRSQADDVRRLKEIVEYTKIDGFNGDTMFGIPGFFYNCSSFSEIPVLIGTAEGGCPPPYIGTNAGSWGYNWSPHSFVVWLSKYLEPRHMVQVSSRWSLDRVNDIQKAVFNGIGNVIWDNIWGIMSPYTERECQALKRAYKMLRYFSNLTISEFWQPYDMLFRFSTSLGSPSRTRIQAAVSKFPLANEEMIFYTILTSTLDNAPEEDYPRTEIGIRKVEDDYIDLNFPLIDAAIWNNNNFSVYDVYHGKKMPVQHVRYSSNELYVSLRVERDAFGALLVVNEKLLLETNIVHNFQSFLEEMSDMTSQPLNKYSTDRHLLPQKITPKENFVSSNVAPGSGNRSASLLQFISGMSGWWFNVSIVVIEPDISLIPNASVYGTGVQYPGESRPHRNHSLLINVTDFWMDLYPVTNAQFRDFLRESNYQPKVMARFLKHWTNRYVKESKGIMYNDILDWQIPSELEDCPVVHVSFEDATNYATYYGLRLPYDWEMQYVMGNGDTYTVYPWGNQMDMHRIPKVVRGGSYASPDRVGEHPLSKSLRYNVEDLVGHVWQMTDRYCDERTCSLLLRGSSDYRAFTTNFETNWYYPTAYRSMENNRLLMQSQHADRSSTIGFRCVKSSS